MKVLVVYGSRYGSTAEVADAIGDALSHVGALVSVHSATDGPEIRGYDAAVVGSGNYGGSVLPELAAWVAQHRDELLHVPLAYFVVGLGMAHDTPESRAKTMLALKALPQLDPVDVGLFAGSTTQLPGLMRLLMRFMGAGGGDRRDWEAIRAWATDLLPKLAAANEPS